MVIERKEQKLGTADNPDVVPMGSEVEVIPEPSRADQIRDAAEILVMEESILIDDEADEASTPDISFDANLSDQKTEVVNKAWVTDAVKSEIKPTDEKKFIL